MTATSTHKSNALSDIPAETLMKVFGWRVDLEPVSEPADVPQLVRDFTAQAKDRYRAVGHLDRVPALSDVGPDESLRRALIAYFSQPGTESSVGYWNARMLKDKLVSPALPLAKFVGATLVEPPSDPSGTVKATTLFRKARVLLATEVYLTHTLGDCTLSPPDRMRNLDVVIRSLRHGPLLYGATRVPGRDSFAHHLYRALHHEVVRAAQKLETAHSLQPTPRVDLLNSASNDFGGAAVSLVSNTAGGG